MNIATAPARTFDRLATLPLQVDGYELSGLEQPLVPDYTRMTTVVRLRGGGLEGVGEDTTYPMPDQLAFRSASPILPLAGEWTLQSFSSHLAELDLFPQPPASEDFRRFRRWAFESAALDLALRQADLSLAEALGREPRPVRFVVSPGPETTADFTLERLARYPDMRLKLMAVPGWEPETMAALAATGAVDVVDLKGQYPAGTPIAVPGDPELYERVLRVFDQAWIEDPALTPATEPILRPHLERVTWDAPIRSVADIAGLAAVPRILNIKPSRFGSLSALLDAYDHCGREGIGMFGGGQFELGPGRRQIQLLAALFHPEGPNDVAPVEYNRPALVADLPGSPLDPRTVPSGF